MPEQAVVRSVRVGHGTVYAYAFSPLGKYVLCCRDDKTVQLWKLGEKRCLRIFRGHTGRVLSIEWSRDQSRAISSSNDATLRLWDVKKGGCLRVFEGHKDSVLSVAWTSDQRLALSGSGDKSVRLWDVESGRCLKVLEGHTGSVYCVAFSADHSRALSGSDDNTVRLWDLESGRCLGVLEGHTSAVRSVAWSIDQRRALSGASYTVRLWDLETGSCLRALEGHMNFVRSLEWSADQRLALSGSFDTTIRLWDLKAGVCLKVLEGHSYPVRSVAWGADQRSAFSGDQGGNICIWDLQESRSEVEPPKASQIILQPESKQVQYTNAKVLLVGDSGAGKTGLSLRLAFEDWQPTDSTVGVWATHWKLPMPSDKNVEREIWLWDFGGQADQRLIHQLYMDDAALAVLVFDGQKEDIFETLRQWDRDLTRASRNKVSKLLVAGRIDAGGLRVSRAQIDAFRSERGYLRWLETSAKADLGCKELKQAIQDGICWEDIPWRSSPLLFKRLKEEIVLLKDAGRVLVRFNELREALQLRLSYEEARFSDEELKAVVSLLAGPGVLWELKFGGWVLLQPERINAYAQAVIQTMREDEHERGCLLEERVLKGDLSYHSSMLRLETDEERFILLAMHQMLVERGLCLRAQTAEGPLLVFPSYYRRERPELVEYPAVFVSYRFQGFLDDIYATLVVRLHHTAPFAQDQLWRYAADFKTLTGKQLGVKLSRRAEGIGEIEVYFDPAIPVEEKIIFSKYVHEHLLQCASDVVRLRHYVCLHCGTPVGNREVAMERLEEWLQLRSIEPGNFRAKASKVEAPTIICVRCEKRVQLWDAMEQSFSSPAIQQQVRALQEQSSIVLDTESKERVLVGELISVVALAGQISREKSVSDHGIDMEIEFKDDNHDATGEMVLLQLKSGDSHLRKRKRDGASIFTIENERHVRYWMSQQFPVLLVIRASNGEIRWMEIRDWLKRASDNGKKPIKQIVFEGERLGVMSVRGWRDKVLRQESW